MFKNANSFNELQPNRGLSVNFFAYKSGILDAYKTQMDDEEWQMFAECDDCSTVSDEIGELEEEVPALHTPENAFFQPCPFGSAEVTSRSFHFQHICTIWWKKKIRDICHSGGVPRHLSQKYEKKWKAYKVASTSESIKKE